MHSCFKLLTSLFLTAGITMTSCRAQAFTNTELKCFSEHKVPYSDGKCYTLHQVGPCPEGQWLVYGGQGQGQGQGQGRGRAQPGCHPRPCNSTGSPIFWPEDGQCHRLSDKKTLCPYKGNVLRSDSYGDGECACEPRYSRFEEAVLAGGRGGAWPTEGHCYPLFHRGPCLPGKLLHPQVLQGFGLVGRCVNDLCPSLNNGSDPSISYVMRKADRQCHRLGTVGPPCGPSEVFAVHPMTHLPECYSGVSNLFTDSAVRCGGIENINTMTGECREKVILKTESFGFEAKRPRRTRRRVRQ